ncbi:hypothetical protein HOD20_01865 [archaeon]|jgi:hypothetical protein|nr:hypothetical protein [archaeon]MBT4351252.1 hypothetical protein [archaeon]MBT4648138.1 hypothetical protein [archaeon]MBT6822444.1 hypothetical protein [archaeon]MBT7392106.1 hypothetical protein [archaeon]
MDRRKRRIRKRKVLKKKKPPFNISKFLEKNLKWILIILIIFIVMHEYIVRIILVLALGIFGVYTLEITRFVPDVSFETVTAASVLFGYLYGWKFATAFALIFGIYGHVKISKMNQISITIILFMVFSAVLADFLAKFGYPFWVVFIGTFVLRAIVSYPVMQLVNPNVLKNMVHAVGDTVFNIAVVIHVFIIIVDVLNALNIK